MVTAGMYNFGIHLDGLSMEELKNSNGNYKCSIRRKNNNGIRVKIDLSLYEKVHGKISPLKQPIKKGPLEIKANNHQNYSVYFNMKISKKSIRKNGSLYKIELRHSIKDYYEIDIEYQCYKEKLDRLEQEYFRVQTKSTKTNESTIG